MEPGRKPWTAEEEAYLVRTYRRVTAVRQAARLGRSLASVLQKRRRLVVAGRLRVTERAWNRPWDAAADAELCALLGEGLPVGEIAHRLRRTPESIERRARMVGASLERRRGRDVYTLAQVSALFGFAAKSRSVRRWRERGWLRAAQNKPLCGSAWLVAADDLMAFLEDPATWRAWEPGQITDPDWRLYAEAARAGALKPVHAEDWRERRTVRCLQCGIELPGGTYCQSCAARNRTPRREAA